MREEWVGSDSISKNHSPRVVHLVTVLSHSFSAQSNFAVGAVVNATFGSITEMTFYITALLRGYSAGSKCYEEVVKAALTGTLLGCILFIPVSDLTWTTYIFISIQCCFYLNS